MYCICCKKNNVVPTESFDFKKDQLLPIEEDVLFKCYKKYGVEYTINNEMIDNGIIQIINAGYGSNHDGDQLIIAICDDCIQKNIEDGTILYWNNYFFTKEGGEKEYIKEEVNKSIKTYRRRKNLDNIII